MSVETSSNHNSTSLGLDIATFPLQGRKGLISNADRDIYFALNFVVICGAISVFGVTANVINIVNFWRQGFADSVNLSLVGLSLSDLGCLLTLIYNNSLMSPWLAFSDVSPFFPFEVQYLTGGWPHVWFTRVTSWITAYIALERCLCIALPLKVKQLLTPFRARVIILSIFLLTAASIAPVYYTTRLAWRFSEKRNKSLLGLAFTSDREEIDDVILAINNVFSPVASFFTVIGCTVILVVKLNSKAKWRESAVSSTEAVKSGRDNRVVKMVVTISVIFIVSYTPTTVIFLTVIMVPELSITGRYQNLFNVLFSFSFIFEAINSSINIFVYMRMSSKYRQTFNMMCWCRSSQ